MNSKMLKKLLSLLTAFALMFSMVPAMGIAASAEAENLLANGDFETTGTWVDGNGTEIGQQQEVPVTTNVYTNDFSGASPLLAWNHNNTSSSVVELNGDNVLSFTPGTNTYVTYYGMSSLVVGDDYILKCKVYTDTDTSFRLYDNATGKNMHKTAAAGQWTEYTVSLTATAAATTLYFGVMDGSGNTVYIDDVAIEHVEKETVSVPLYSNDFSGTSPLLAWNYSNTTSSVVELDGNKVLSFAPGANTYITYYGMNSLVVGNDYVMSCKILCDTNVYFRLYDNATGKYAIKTALAGQWTEYTVNLTATATSTTLYFGIMDSNAGPVYIDDVCIASCEMQNATSYSDGIGDCNGAEESSVLAMSANAQVSQPVALSAGNTYGYSFDVKGDSTAALSLLNGDAITVSEDWTTVTGSFVADSADSSFGFVCTAGAVLLDNVSVWQESTSTNITVGFDFVNVDNTWYLTTDSTEGANGYYKMTALVDGVEQSINIQRTNAGFTIWPNQFQDSVVPVSRFVIPAGTVLTSSSGTITIVNELDVSYVDGAWGITVPNVEMTVGFDYVNVDNTWYLTADSAEGTNGYYKMTALVDGVEQSINIQRTNAGFTIWPNQFQDSVVPVSRFVIPAGTVLTSSSGTITIVNELDVSYVDGVWGITVPNVDITLNFGQVTADNGTWQFTSDTVPENQYHKLAVTVDGVQCNVIMGQASGLMVIYPDFFFGNIPANRFEIAAGTVMVPVDNNNNWNVISGGTTLTVTNTVTVENAGGTWVDMSQYAGVTFTEVTAADLNVYRTEDQADSQYRSVFAIEALNGIEIGNEGWANFTEVASKVLVDGNETDVVFGMVPADDGWGKASAFLLYITGEGYWDAATTASAITICAGTTIISPLDTSKGFKFTEDFVMYKNCDGSWDTTADTHIYNQQNTEAEGALVSAANCQSAAVYYYSCSCGQLSSETFTSGELGEHSYVNGDCQYCDATAQEITLSLQTVTADGSWQLIPSETPANKYYKANVVIDGTACNILLWYDASGVMIVDESFFCALNGKVPTQSLVIPAGTIMKAVDSANGWAEIEDAAVLVVNEELEITNIAGKWVEMSKYADVTFTEIYGADLDVYYQNILRAGDYSDAEIALMKLQYPEYADLIDIYGRDANMTTFGIKSTIPSLQIPNDENWATFTLLGTITVSGATPAETYVLQTRDSSYTDSETAMDNAFLIRFYNGFVADQAASVTIEPGTRIIASDGVTGFVFVDGYTIYRDADGNWSDTAPTGTVKSWGLTLGDQIGVEFDVALAETDTVEVAVNGTAADFTKVDNGDGTYTVTVKLAAVQMTDSIALSINGVALDRTYSVREYADIILAGSYGDLTVNLVKNMLGYGAASQTYFGYNTQNLANAGIDVEASAPTGNAGLNVTGSVSGIKYYGATLVHENKTAVRLYFTADSIEGITFTVNGAQCEATNAGLYYVELDGINPQNLDDAVEAVISNGTESMTVTYSPMDYILRMYQKGSANTQALVQALYGYYVAAEAYVG